MEDTKVADWRVWKAATVSADTMLPDGKPVKAGDVMYVVSNIRESGGKKLCFATPSPVALALSISIAAAHEAALSRNLIHYTVTGDGTHFVPDPALPDLFAYFEQCMMAVTFSFQSLEAFTNQIIGENLPGTLNVKRKDGEREWDAASIERNCSTEEKLSDILPRLGALKSPKGTKAWEDFTKLKRLRDSTIHMKTEHQYVREREDKSSLYYRFLNHNPKEYPRWAMAILRHYTPKETDAWLRMAEDKLNGA